MSNNLMSNNLMSFPVLDNIKVKYLPETSLFFKNNVMDIDQKRGLSIHGPVDAVREITQTIRIGIISDSEGIESVTNLFEYLNENTIKNSGNQPFTTLSFPSIKKAFNSQLIFEKRYSEKLLSREISRIANKENPNARIKEFAELYAHKVSILCDKSSGVDVIICHKPKIVEESTGAYSYFERKKYALKGKEKKKAKEMRKIAETHKLLAPLDEDTLNFIELSVKNDFRRILKARCMKSNIPIQILNQSTLESINYVAKIPNIPMRDRKNEDASTIAWNISTALYCKANHSPWHVNNLKDGTCYIGISFYYDQTTHENNMFSSLAQVFSDTGEGLIVKGDTFHWNTKERREPHLTNDAANDLLIKALDLYKSHHNEQAPNRVVIHKSSGFSSYERSGFLSALDETPKYDFLTLSSGMGVFYCRNGDNPMLRGAFITLPGYQNLLYTAGYIPYMKSYYRPRIPLPLLFAEHYGDTTAEELAQEIMALSRLDWNTTRYCSRSPITLKFSQRVGKILGIVPKGDPIQHQYWFYM